MDVQSSALKSSRQSAQADGRSSANLDWLNKPLCCRYVFAGFNTLHLPVREGNAVKDVSWRWALGLFKQNQYEVLGAWPAQALPALLAQDLDNRGVEHIKAISADDHADLAPNYPDATRWPSTDECEVSTSDSARVFGRRRRAALQSAAAKAERLQLSITRAIKRRAPFADETAAVAFLAQTLQAVDRRFYEA